MLLAERHGDPVTAVVLLYRVGARNESEREAGISHFLEHMMFKGTPRFGKSEVDRITAELGGQNNAFTGYDHTAYWFELASDRWEHALEIEADRMRNLLLDPEEFSAERAVVLEELAMGEDDPWRVLTRRVEAALFPRHPYGRPIIGFPDTLAGLSPADMRDYYQRFYHPANATLVVAGDIRRSSVLQAVRAHFGGLEAGTPFERADCFRAALEEPPGPVRLVTRWDDEARRLILAWPTVPVGTDEDYALDLALTVLASGRASRLQRRLVFDASLATSVSGSNDTRVESGAFWLFVEAGQRVAPEEIERVVDEELVRLATERVPRNELQRAKSVLRSAEAFDGETVSDVAEEIGEWAVDAEWRLAFDGGARHDRVTAEEVRATVARYLSPARRVAGWCLPKKEAQAAARSGPEIRRRAARKTGKKRKAKERPTTARAAKRAGGGRRR